MKKKRALAVHPLFWMLGVYFCFTGELPVFLLITLASLEHELAHALMAQRFGYALDQIVLLPYGAALKGDIGGIGLKEELLVALIGPLVSGLTCCLFGCLWWFFPETYPFTDGAFYACLSLALVNLLPAAPLDGGRVLYCILARFLPKTRAWWVCKALSVLFSTAGAGLFIYGVVKGETNISLLLFSVFLLVGVISGEKHSYSRIRYDLSADLSSGVSATFLAVGKDYPLKKCLPLLAEKKYPVLLVIDGEETFVLRRETLVKWAETGEWGECVGDFLEKEKKTKIPLEIPE